MKTGVKVLTIIGFVFLALFIREVYRLRSFEGEGFGEIALFLSAAGSLIFALILFGIGFYLHRRSK